MGRHRGTGRRPSARPRRAAHRLGQVGGLLRGHPAAARTRSRPDGHRVPAARAHAQPDRRSRARRHPGGDDQLDQHRPVAADPRPDPRRRGRRAAGEPRAAQQPGVPRRGAAPARRELRTAGRRRGPLHLRLGPRLPSRLPPPAHPPGRAAGWHPGARHHGHRQLPRHRRRGRAARCPRRRRPGPRAVRRGARAAGHARPRLAPAGSGEAQDARAAARLAGRPPRRAARLGHRLLPHRGGDPGGRVLPP